ncbi:MAG: hypothetical protein VB096_02510 [Pseudoflavonifractor sp.]|nr:hypothetical protein [Pseudoflavonifractor sp.]
MNTFYEYEGIFGRAETAHLNSAGRVYFPTVEGGRRHAGPVGGGAAAAVPGNQGRQNGLLDIVRLRDLYRTLTALLGSEYELERLNLLLRQRFLIVTPMSAFLQRLTNDLLYSLVSRDIETGKQAVQLAGIGE